MNRKLCPCLGALVVAAALGPLAAPALADCADPFGKPEELLEFHVKMAKADWDKLLASKVTNVDPLPVNSPQCADAFPEFKAEFRCGNETEWLKVGVRKKKGEERGVEAPLKPPLKIDFNEDFMGMQPTAKGQRWPANMGELAYRKLTMNNGQGNKPVGRSLILPVLLSEHVAMRMLAKEIPAAPRTAYAKLMLYTEDKPQGEYHGVYILIEDIDRTALRRRGFSAVGNLTKASTANCNPESVFADGPPNPATDAFNAFNGKNPASFPGKWMEEVAKGMDLDTLIRQEVIREVLVNGNDTIFNSVNATNQGNNWYAYDPRDGLRQYMPWDVDLTFGNQNGSCAPTPLKCAPSFPLLAWCSNTFPKLGKVIPCNPEGQKRYLETMCQLVNGPLHEEEILKVWNQADATVRAAVAAERQLIWGGMDPLSTGIDKSYGAEYERLKGWIPQRIQSVRQQIAAKGVTCAAGCPAGGTSPCSYNGCPSQRRCENNRWTACLPPSGGCGVAAPGVDGGVPPTPGQGGSGGGADAGSPSGSGGSAGAGNPGAGGSSPGAGGSSGGGATTGGSSGGSNPGTGGSSGGGTPRAGGSSGATTPTPTSSGNSGGCTVTPGTPSSTAALSFLLMALAGLGLRRRRH